MELIKNLKHIQVQAETEINAKISDFIKEMEAQPENKDITPLNESGTIYTVNFSSLNVSKNLSPYYYSFKLQIKLIKEKLNKCNSIKTKISTLDEIIKTGKIINSRYSEHLHPTIINRLKKILL